MAAFSPPPGQLGELWSLSISVEADLTIGGVNSTDGSLAMATVDPLEFLTLGHQNAGNDNAGTIATASATAFLAKLACVSFSLTSHALMAPPPTAPKK